MLFYLRMRKIVEGYQNYSTNYREKIKQIEYDLGTIA
jgi:hypothetical protein